MISVRSYYAGTTGIGEGITVEVSLQAFPAKQSMMTLTLFFCGRVFHSMEGCT